MKNVLTLLNRLCGIPLTSPTLRVKKLSVVELSDWLFNKAHEKAIKRQSVLKTRRQKLLARIIGREFDRHHASLMRKEQTNLTSNGSMLSDFYLRSGYLYFADFGISADSQFNFLELGIITPTFYREIKLIPKYLSAMMWKGDDRKEEFQRQWYDKLFDRLVWNPRFRNS